MNENLSLGQDRSSIAARFFSRLHRLKNLLFSRWWILVLGAALGVGMLYLLAWRSPPSYVSNSRMIVGGKLPLGSSGGYSEELNNFYGTQVSLMQSVSNQAAVRVMTTKPEVGVGGVSLNVSVSPKTSIFNLQSTGSNPDFTQAFLDAVMEEYGALKKSMRAKNADNTQSVIQSELARMEAELAKGKLALMDYQSNNSVVFLQERGNSAAEYLAYLTKQQANLKSELQLLRMLTLDENVERQMGLAQQGVIRPTIDDQRTGTARLKQEGSQNVPLTPGTDDVSVNKPGGEKKSSLVGTESDYLKAKQQILLLKAQRQELSEFLRPKHPKIIALDEEIARKEKLLDIFREQSQDQIKALEHSLALEIENLEVQIKEWEGKSLEISRKMSEFQTINQENRRLQEMYDRLRSTSFSVDVDKGLSQETVNILEPASPPALKPFLSTKRLVLSAILGLMLGVTVLLLIDHLDDRPASYAELQEMVDEEVLGQIPRVRSKGKAKLIPIIQSEDDRHAMVEAYRNLRSSIMFNNATNASEDNHPRTLLVTSAIPGDGKSMTTANLAVTLARGGAKVLLVDADLRRGIMHKHFSIEAAPGFSQVLMGRVQWSDVVVHTEVPNLDLIPRGEIVRHPGELFVQPAKKKFIDEARAFYEYVLFDTAPVMAADDVSNIAPHVEGVIMVIRAGYTSGRVARAALDMLAMRRAKLLGVVFNAVRSNTGDYYYYHYKDYYAKYPSD